MTIEKISSTKIADKTGEIRAVKPGDLVDLAKPNDEFMIKCCGGEGPYKIGWIGRWPCGRDSIYLDKEGKGRGHGFGANTTNFVYAGTN